MVLGSAGPGLESDRRVLREARLATPDHLHAYLRLLLGFDMPRRAIVSGHDSPFDYLCHSFFEDRRPRDCVVWANRGGGKTQIGAIATLLDLLFKPGIQVRILAGSFDQSSRMYSYLRRMLMNEAFGDLVRGNLTGRSVELVNGSRVEVLSQSERAVRGQRVHKVRCDEVELIDDEIWSAAQLVTRSGRCGDIHVHAAVEALSTAHEPHGLMQDLIGQALRPGGAQSRRLFRWNVLDVLERCELERSCGSCALWSDCGGRAKLPSQRGFMRIDDAVQQHHRVDPEVWKAEMLCQQPSRRDSVYRAFDPEVHVYGAVDDDDRLPRPADVARLRSGDSAIDKPVARKRANRNISTSPHRHITKSLEWIGGIDFGNRAPTVLLWARVDGDDVVHVEDELAAADCLCDAFIERARRHMQARGLPMPSWVGADPAGLQRNEHTGLTTIGMWRAAGWTIRARRMRIEPGLRAVSRRLRDAGGRVGLRIHRRCTTLIQAMAQYRYPARRPDAETPLKDGHDHAADALRYMITNLDRPSWSEDSRLY